MKKYLCMSLIIMLMVSSVINSANASIASIAIKRLIPAGMQAGANGSRSIPALAKGVTSSGLQIASWVTLLLPATATARIACALLGVAGGLGADYLMNNGFGDWLTSKGIDQDLNKTTNVPVPDGWTKDSYEGDIGIPGEVGGGIFSNQEAAYQAAVAYHASSNASNCNASMGSINVTYRGTRGYWVQTNSPCSAGRKNFYYALPGALHNEEKKEPVSNEQLKTEYSGSLSSGSDNNANKAADAALKTAADALDNPGHPASQNTPAMNEILDAMKSALTPAQLAALEASGTEAGDTPIPDEADKNAVTPAQIAAAVQAALQGQNLSAQQIAAAIAAALAAGATGGLTQAQVIAAITTGMTDIGLTPAQIAAAIASAMPPPLTPPVITDAVKNALNDETGVSLPTDTDSIIPEKLSLTAVLNSFMAAINSLPMFQTLQGLTINVGGSSQLCVNLPGNLGGAKCFDGGRVQGELNMIGSAFLGLTTIICFVGIFKG